MEVDLSKVRRNYLRIRALDPAARVMAVLKGDAYGLGAGPIARALSTEGVHAFAVDSVAEAVELREAGVREQILVIDDVADNAVPAVQHQLTPAIANVELLRAYEAAAKRLGRRVAVWLVVNVGFNRCGERTADGRRRLFERARLAENLDVQAVSAHLSYSHGDVAISTSQMADYDAAVRLARDVLEHPVQTSLLATHGIVRWSGAFRTDWIRPGLLLYGEHTFEERMLDAEVRARLEPFESVLTLRARISQLISVDTDQPVGYGSRYRARAGQRLATLTLGYGHGYGSPTSDHGLEAIVHGRRVPLIGAAGMDALQVDVTDVPDVRLWDWATLIGRQDQCSISVSDVARRAGTPIYQAIRQLRCSRTYVADSTQH
jgi:alanine racemase